MDLNLQQKNACLDTPSSSYKGIYLLPSLNIVPFIEMSHATTKTLIT